MSDLTASNCGCGGNNGNGCGCGNLIWIILLLSCCNGSGNGLLGNSDGFGLGNNSSCNN